MAGRRIRTIKPDLFEDAKVARLTCSAFRLFVGCISLADDHGNLRGDVEYLRGQIFWGKPTVDVQAALDELMSADVLAGYQVRDQTYLHVCKWEKHQKIDKPGAPRLPLPSDPDARPFANVRESSRVSPPAQQGASRTLAVDLDLDLDLDLGPGPRTLDQDRSAGGSPTTPTKSARTVPAKTSDPSTPGSVTFAAYAREYRQRYGTDPVRNHKVNIAFSDLVKRLGATEAPEVAAHYVRHNGALYVQSGHAPGLLLRDAEKLRTEWATGRKVNAAAARQREQSEACGFRQIIDEMEREERVEHVDSEVE